MKERVCIIGSGNWGSAIATVIGANVIRHESKFEREVHMWVLEEKVDGKNLSDIINSKHENVKYLPGIKLPENIVAEPNLLKAAKGCTIYVVVIPHLFVVATLEKLGKLPPDSKVISLVKGIDSSLGLSFFSDIMKDLLGVEVGVLMGANVADEVAQGKFCESTIASRNPQHQELFKQLLHTPNFRVAVTDDVIGTELCGALKNVVALAAGFCDGLGWGSNTKAAIVRIGLQEIRKFAFTFYSTVQDATFYESCGVGDLITTCYNGRNRRLAELFAKTNKSFAQLEKEHLNGQHLQGPLTAKEVYDYLKENQKENEFPLLTTVYRISFEGLEPKELLRDFRS